MNLGNPSDELNPPCEGRYDLFESTHIADHRLARKFCDTCPLAIYKVCRELSAEQSYHDGTWAGLLYINGKESKVGRRARAKAGAA